jgi:hypothetical protein
MSTPSGNPKHEAVESKRGYLYQDYATALQWLALKPDEFLFIEVAEDYALASEQSVIATQVKDTRASSVTLNSQNARDALANFVELRELNKDVKLSFVYLTTSIVGQEQQREHRTGDVKGIDYWENVKSGADPVVLRNALLAMNISEKLRSFIEARDVNEFVMELVAPVQWITGAAPVDELRDQLANLVAAKAVERSKMNYAEGRRLIDPVLTHVQLISVKNRPAERSLNLHALHELIETNAFRVVDLVEYNELKQQAGLARNAPAHVLDADINARVDKLRLSRYFTSFDKGPFAQALGNDVRRGGSFELASPQVRVRALAWAARGILDTNSDLANELVVEAQLVGVHPELTYTEALIIEQGQPAAALQRLAGDTSPAAISARYIAQRRSSTAAEALVWLESSGWKVADLDPDGRFLVLEDLAATDLWDQAIEAAATEAWDPSSPHPASLLSRALCKLVQAIAVDKRHEVWHFPPMFAAPHYPLISDSEGLAARAEAIALFEELERVAHELDLEEVEWHAQEYSLWLSLIDRNRRALAEKKLAGLLASPRSRERFIPLAMSCELPIDLKAVSSELDSKVARDGEIGFFGARARLATLLHKDPHELLEAWPRYVPEISSYFEIGRLKLIEARALISVGRLNDANTVLQSTEEGPDRRAIEGLLAAGDLQTDADYVELARAAFNASGAISDQEDLADTLAKAGRWTELVPIATSIFTKTRTVHSAEKVIYSMQKARQWQALSEFIDSNRVFVSQSSMFADATAQSLWFRADWEGMTELLESGEVSANVVQTLRLQSVLLSMAWDGFGPIIDGALANQGAGRTAEQMLMVSTVAMTLGRMEDAKRLTVMAVAMEPDNPSVLMTGYMHSVRGMWERDEEVVDWLPSAVRHSGPDGPLQAKSLPDLLDMAPQWREQTEKAWKGAREGDVWLSLYARRMNTRLSQVTTSAALHNLEKVDVRQRSLIPLFSGTRAPQSIGDAKRVAIDPAALLILTRLGLLEHLRTTFESVCIPFSTGAWLFEEIQNVGFHQPQRVEEAERLVLQIARDQIKVITPDPVLQRSESTFGNDLACLIGEAKTLVNSGKKAYVIRTSPVSHIADLLMTEVDMSDFSDTLRSGVCLLDSLAAQQIITSEEWARYHSYLRSQDGGWVWDSPIPAGSTLLFDSLSIHYFQHLNLLEVVHRAGFKILVHPEVKQDALGLADLRGAIAAVQADLFRLRDFLTLGIAAKSIEVLPAPFDQWTGRSNHPEPLLELLADNTRYDALILDERPFNKHVQLEDSRKVVIGVYTSLDLIDHLHATSRISDAQRIDKRTQLRRAGAVHIPIEAAELRRALEKSAIVSGSIVESVELRAIRENLTLVQARGILQLPGEQLWLDAFNLTATEVIKNLWDEPVDLGWSNAAANWLMHVANPANFGDQLPGEMTFERSMALEWMTQTRLLIIIGSGQASEGMSKWLNEAVCVPMKRNQPLAYQQMLAYTKSNLKGFHDHLRDELGLKPLAKLSIARAITEGISAMPGIVKDDIADDSEFLASVNLRSNVVTLLQGGEAGKFDRDQLHEAGRRCLETREPVEIIDLDDRVWTLKSQDGAVVHISGEGMSGVPLAPLTYESSQISARLGQLDRSATELSIPLADLRTWVEEVSAGPLTLSQIDRLDDFLKSRPEAVHAEIEAAFLRSSVSAELLLITSTQYVDALVGPWEGEEEPAAFGTKRVLFLSEAIASTPDLAVPLLHHALLSSSHANTSPSHLIGQMSVEALREAIRGLDGRLDLISHVGLLEGLLTRPDAISSLGDVVKSLLIDFQRRLNSEESVELSSAICRLIESRLHRTRLFSEAPDYWRRMASFAHAAAIERVVLGAKIEILPFIEWVAGNEADFNATGLVSLRESPRWVPFHMQDHQCVQEAIGRILPLCDSRKEELAALGLGGIVWDHKDSNAETKESLQGLRELASLLPGPLEGALAPVDLPYWLAEHVRTLLRSDSDRSKCWIFAATAGCLAKVPQDIEDLLIADLDKNWRETLSAQPQRNTIEVLGRLASYAAAARWVALADTVGGIARQLTTGEDEERNLSAYACWYVNGVAAACEPDFEPWKARILSISNFSTNTCMDREDAIRIVSSIRAMCEVEWRLKQPLTANVLMLDAFARSAR